MDAKPTEPPQHDEETRELLQTSRRVSRHTGIPVDVLMMAIAKLVVAEQLRIEGSAGPESATDPDA